MDAIYLYNKYGKPVTWEQWVAVREILDYVLTIYKGTAHLRISWRKTNFRPRYVNMGSSEQEAELCLLQSDAVGCI